jgi:two-component system phosphate regulon sensor histidine kinase PhoR
MFWRLLFAFTAFGVLTSTFVAVLLLRMTGAPIFPDLVTQTGPVILVSGMLAVVPAWIFARQFMRPFRELREGAQRITDGEYGQWVSGGAWRESRELARSFNDMSGRLAWQFNRLAAERHQLATILGGMIEGVVAVGDGQRVLFANEAAGRMLEFAPEAAIGRPFWEMTRQPSMREILEKSLYAKQSMREQMEFTGPYARHLTVYVAPLLKEDTPGAVIVLHDTSELHRLEQLRQEFVANVSHELKTPLAVIQACVETLIDGAVDDTEVRGSFLAQIAEQSERLHALILDLISLARIESGQELMENESVNLGQMVQLCLERHQPRAEAKQMTVTEEASATEEVSVWGDTEALRQILDNLVDNAVKYTQEGGAINVRWGFADNNMVTLSVQDNGPGIPERDLPRIFERFYRVDKARSRELGGTGLGLAIVKHLVQTMHGTVKVSSMLGKGTTFTVTLPRSLEA